MGLTRKKRLVAVCALTPVALSFLGLLSLDVMLRLGGSSTREAEQARDAMARARLAQTLTELVSSGNRESHERRWQTARWLAGRCVDRGRIPPTFLLDSAHRMA
jgi:hypothetical protein